MWLHIRPIDPESGLFAVVGQFVINGIPDIAYSDVSSLYDWTYTPKGAVPDGATVTFVLQVTNTAGLTTISTINDLVDSSLPECLGVQYITMPGTFDGVQREGERCTLPWLSLLHWGL